MRALHEEFEKIRVAAGRAALDFPVHVSVVAATLEHRSEDLQPLRVRVEIFRQGRVLAVQLADTSIEFPAGVGAYQDIGATVELLAVRLHLLPGRIAEHAVEASRREHLGKLKLPVKEPRALARNCPTKVSTAHRVPDLARI